MDNKVAVYIDCVISNTQYMKLPNIYCREIQARSRKSITILDIHMIWYFKYKVVLCNSYSLLYMYLWR